MFNVVGILNSIEIELNTHLMQPFFLELHNRQHFEVYVYALNPDDGSTYRRKVVAGCDHLEIVEIVAKA